MPEGAEGQDSSNTTGNGGFPLSLMLSLCFSGLIAIAIGAVLWISFASAKDNMLRLLGASGESIVDAMVEQVESHLASAESQAEFVAGLIAEGELDPAGEDRLGDILLGSLGGAREIYGIAYITEDYQMTGVGRGPRGLIRRKEVWKDKPSTKAWMRWARESDGPAWIGIHWIEDLGEPGLIYLQPVRVDNRFRGVMLSAVTLRALSEFIANISDQTELTSFILSGDGAVIAHAALKDAAARGGKDAPLPTLESLDDPDLALFSLPADFDLREVRPHGTVDGKLIDRDDRGVVFFHRSVVGFGPEAWTFGVYAPLEQVDRSFEGLRIALLVGIAILGLAVLAAVVLALEFASLWRGHVVMSSVQSTASVSLLVLAVLSLFRHLVRARRVTTEQLLASITLMLLLGVLFGIGYAALDLLPLEPAAFQGLTAPEGSSGSMSSPRASELLYFSYVTLTTLGYGDITPVHPVARSLATLEALTGQLYIAVLVARLVALHIMHSGARDAPGSDAGRS